MRKKVRSNLPAERKMLTGAPKAWAIFMIVYTSAAAASMLGSLIKAGGGLAFAHFASICGATAGSVLILRKKSLGFWCLLGSSILVELTHRAPTSHTILPFGGLLLLALLSLLITRKQFDFLVRFAESALLRQMLIVGSIVGYAALVALVFIFPELPGVAAGLMLFGSIVIYRTRHTSDEEHTVGALLFFGSLFLFVLVYLVHPSMFK
jgi:hypothetical protein